MSDNRTIKEGGAELENETDRELPWGRHYLMVRPDHFRVAYSINPYMRLDDQPDPTRARHQWETLLGTLRAAGADVSVLGQRADAPDMVFAMNLGLAVRSGPARRVVLSHMRHAERRVETEAAKGWFADTGHRTTTVGRDGRGEAFFEAGDAFPYGDALVAGFGPRSTRQGLRRLARRLDTRVRALRIVHPRMYHLDLAFCPLSGGRAMVAPSAFDDDSARALLSLVPEPLVLTEEEALTFCANAVVVGRTVVMPACPPRVRARLAEWGLDVVVVDVSELHKGGGSVRCLTNPLDIQAGRDLPVVPGGELVLPRRARDRRADRAA